LSQSSRPVRGTSRPSGTVVPQRSRTGLVVVVIIVVVVAAVVAAFLLTRKAANNTSASVTLGGPVPTAVLERVEHIPNSVLAKVGANPQLVAAPKPIPNGKPLVANGKPEIVYIGAEYCPYCAAERWALVGALSRFGTFSGLGLMESSATDVYPSTNTFTFLHATYRSKYLTLVTREITTRTYQPLQKLTQAEQRLINTYDVVPYVSLPKYDGSIPFVDFGNRYVINGASYSPQVLAGLNWPTIAAALADPETSVAQSVDGAVNEITAAVCSITHNKPGAVCQQPYIQRIERSL
jgi:thiol-disulfide isomerase/thioredoxin